MRGQPVSLKQMNNCGAASEAVVSTISSTVMSGVGPCDEHHFFLNSDE